MNAALDQFMKTDAKIRATKKAAQNALTILNLIVEEAESIDSYPVDGVNEVIEELKEALA